MATIHELLAAQNDHIEMVTISIGDVSVRPVRMIELLRVIARFPDLKKLFFGTDNDTLLSVLVQTGPDAIAAVLACATFAPGDLDVERGLAALPDDDLIKLAGKVVSLTMPEGIEGFFGKFASLAEASGLIEMQGQSELNAA